MKLKAVAFYTCILFLAVLLAFACQQPMPTSKAANAKSEQLASPLHFSKIDSVNPVMGPGSGTFICPVRKQRVNWEEKDVFNPAAVVMNDTMFLVYRAEDSVGKYAGTSRLGLAYSLDGLHFTRLPEPVLFPQEDEQKKFEWEGGCEDPRVVADSSGRFIMSYTAYDGDKARLMIAASPDLRHWTKYGPAFAKAYDGRYLNKWSKSGSIVSTARDGKMIATPINGKYWMYWGDVNINAATSEDLINWTPVEMQAGERPEIVLRHNATETPNLKIVLGPRPGLFDADIVEPGPPAILTDKGILLIYNGRNTVKEGDAHLAEGTYSCSEALMDKTNPLKVLSRSDKYFMTPDKGYEKKGQVNNVCFAEGLAFYKGQWFLYYGTADAQIAVASFVQ